MDKPKFKVGDRVNIDWDNCIYDKYEEYVDNGIVVSYSDDVQDLVYVDHFKQDMPMYELGFYEHELTLVESKPKCKFKVDDHVFITSILSFGKITDIGDVFEEGQSYRVKLYNDVKAKYFYEKDLTLSGENSDIPTAKSKPKWSAGTYVEILRYTNETFGKFIKGRIYTILDMGFASNLIKMIQVTDGVRDIININGARLYDLQQRGILKWHENKPKKEVSALPQKDDTASDIIERIKKYNILWTEGGNKVFDYSGATAGKECIVEYDAKRLPEHYIADECGLTQTQYYDPINTIIRWSHGRNVLDKPQIKISKQKSINININKQKI